MESFQLIKKFWTFNQKESLGHSIISVYLFLIDVWDNENKSKFSISDKQVSIALKISRKTVKAAKDTLSNLGLLSYENRNGFSSVYTIITDYDILPETSIEKKIKAKKVKSKKTISTKKEVVISKDNVSIPKSTLPTNIPTEQEFLLFAQSLSTYDKNIPNIDFLIKEKYDTWKSNGWKNKYGKPIRNWQSTLKSSLPYVLTQTKHFFTPNIPRIKRPK